MSASSAGPSSAGIPPPRGSARLATKEKRAAPTQITAEQLLRESAALQSEERRAPSRKLVDEDELNEYRIRKRKGFEDSLRRKRHAISIWLSYASWEAEQKDFRRARSVYERTLEIDYQRVEVWTKYLDMECSSGFINSARNLFDRACHLLPRIDYFWLRYTTFEEALQNFAGARKVFERWMEWKPEDRAWIAYVKFEERCGEIDRARSVLERFLVVHPRSSSFSKFALWEESQGNFVRARAAFEKALEVLPVTDLPESFFLKFARFEENRKNLERASNVYSQGLKILEGVPGSSCSDLRAAFLSFQRRLGSKEEVEDTILSRRREYYEALLKKTDGYDYDVWINYVRLEIENLQNRSPSRVRAVCDRFKGMKPPVNAKNSWKRYFYLYISYAFFEELKMKDMERASKLWEELLDLIPHKTFSFAKFWKLYSQFEIRRGNLAKARLIFGRAIAEYPNKKIFKYYAEMELKLGQLDRCRQIYAKFIEQHPTNPHSWLSLIDVELLAQEYERARKLFEMAIEYKDIQNIELIWKTYIDVEANLNQFENCRNLFDRLIKLTNGHYKVFQAFAWFEFKAALQIQNARDVFQQGVNHCKELELDAERALLLESWLKMEKEHEAEVGRSEVIEKVRKMLPKKIKKRRTLVLDDGVSTSVEEYTAYLFPDEAYQASSLAILEAAKRWKKRKMEESGGGAG